MTEASSNMKMRISDLEGENAKLKDENIRLRSELELKNGELKTMRSHGTALDIENQYLKTMLYLSVERVRLFVGHLSNMEQWAFLSYTLPEQYRTEQMDVMEEVMALPQDAVPQITVTDATFDAMYKISGNAEVNPGGASNV